MKRRVLDLVKNQLRQEAQAIRRQNAFSPLLHQRCMDALRRQGLPADTTSLPHNPSAWRFALPLGIAAAAAFAAWLVLHSPTTPSTPAPQIVKPDPIPVLPDTLTPALNPDLANATADSLDQRKFAYLDRDAQRLFTFLANQLPDFPQPPATETPRP